MTAQEIRFSILDILSDTQDQAVLKAYHDILKTLVAFRQQTAAGWEVDGKPIAAGELEQDVLNRLKNAKAGNFTRHEDFVKMWEKRFEQAAEA